ncbi:MAG: PadR family transcriptional regulator [Caldilineaceae bacterium]
MRNRNMRPDSQGGRSPGARQESQSGGDSAEDRQEGAHERKRHGRGSHGKGRGRHGERHGGRRSRARRGDTRYILLDALRAGPKHGYEIIKAVEERSAGEYIPSPGTVYPTLQYLEDQGFVRAIQEAERRVYQLTEAGQAELAAQAKQVTAFWQRFTDQGVAAASQHEVTFLQEELDPSEPDCVEWAADCHRPRPAGDHPPGTERSRRVSREDSRAYYNGANSMTIPEKSMESYDGYISGLFAVEDEILRATRGQRCNRKACAQSTSQPAAVNCYTCWH